MWDHVQIQTRGLSRICPARSHLYFQKVSAPFHLSAAKLYDMFKIDLSSLILDFVPACVEFRIPIGRRH
jgi:hypothetical protein